MPCDWITLKDELIEEATARFTKNNLGKYVGNLGQIITSSHIWKSMYQRYIGIHYGKLDLEQRIPLPVCVESKIKIAFSEKDDTYMGFKES